jgi:hypothetical protein|tara:strand:+ start:1622 stop:1867 length:246 start_codon:yes stop_codon:yes gene_type:complete
LICGDRFNNRQLKAPTALTKAHKQKNDTKYRGYESHKKITDFDFRILRKPACQKACVPKMLNIDLRFVVNDNFPIPDYGSC